MVTKKKNTLESPESGNVDKIREIIFGGQMRDYERRFNELESQIRADLDSLRELWSRQLKSLEDFVKTEVSRLNDRVQADKKDSKESFRKVESDLREAASVTEQSIQELDNRLSAEQRDIRTQIHAQSQSFEEALVQMREALKKDTSRLGDRLESEKVSRQELSGFFTEVAMRLQGEFDLPEG